MAKYEEKDNVLLRVAKYLIPWEGDKPGEKVRKLIFLAAAVVLIVTVSILVVNGITQAQDNRRNSEIQDIYHNGSSSKPLSNSEDSSGNSGNVSGDTSVIIGSNGESSSSSSTSQPTEIIPSLKDIYELNHDTIGWITIADDSRTVVDLPVLQSEDNEYYLTHDFDGNPSRAGALYADYHAPVTATERPANIVIYGHNMGSGEYFGQLFDYCNYSESTGDPTNISMYKRFPTITFNTLYKESTYKIFGGMLVNVEEEYGEVFPYHMIRDFETKSDFDNFCAEVLDRSTFINPDVDLKYGDNLITLSTCSWGYGTPNIGNGDAQLRWVIVAREVRDGEDPSVDVEKAYYNPSPKFCEAYYRNYIGYGEWEGRGWKEDIIYGYNG